MLVTDLGTDVQWTLLRGDEQRVTADQSVSDGLEWLADQYAQEYSVVGGVRTLRMVVQGVDDLDDYGRVMTYLNGLNALQTVDVESLADGVLTLHIAARGDEDVLTRTFTLGRVLQPSTAAGPQGTGVAAGTPGGGPTGTGPSEVQNTLVFRVAGSGTAQ